MQIKCSQHKIDLNVVLAYCWRPAPHALACVSPWFRRRMEQLNWIGLVSHVIPEHYPEISDDSSLGGDDSHNKDEKRYHAKNHHYRKGKRAASTANLILGDGKLFREGIAVPRRCRRRVPPGCHHHNAMLLDQLWRQGLLSRHSVQGGVVCLKGTTDDVLVMEDMSCICHIFLSNDAPPPTEHLLYWLARPRCSQNRQWATGTRMPLAVDEMAAVAADGAWCVAGSRGDSRFLSRARGLALHVTERHLPWLATAIVTELPHLQELYLSLDEGRIPSKGELWRWVKWMLTDRPGFRVLCLWQRPTPLSGMPQKTYDDEDVLAPYVEEREPVNILRGAPGCTINSIRNNSECGAVDLAEGIRRGDQISSRVFPLASSSFALMPNTAAGYNKNNSHTLQRKRDASNIHGLLDTVDLQGLRHMPWLEVLYICPSVIDSLPFLSNLTALRELYLLSNHKLQSSGLYGVEDLRNLEVMWLEGTCIRQLPPLSCSTSLRELHVALDPSFTTLSLRGVECIPTLEVLHLEQVCVDNLSFIGGSKSLRELIVHACRMFSTKSLQGVETAPLEYVSLAYTNGVRDVSFLATCTTLRQLFLTRCNGVGTVSIMGLELLPKLELLALEFTRVDSTKLLAESPSLSHLRLNGCKRVLRGSICGLDSCVTLQYLSLQDTNVINVEALYNSCSLVELDLSYCKHLEQCGVEGIAAIPTLKILRLSHTHITSVAFLQISTSLEELYVDHCLNICSMGLYGIELVPTLHTLSMTNIQASDVGFLGRSQHLEVLHIASMERLRTSGIRGLEKCVNLRHLNMAFCGVDSVTCLASGCPNLRCLNLRGCQQLETEGLRGLETLPSLTDLILDDLDLISDINHFASSPSLRRLSAMRCTSLTLGGVHDLLVCLRPIQLDLW